MKNAFVLIAGLILIIGFDSCKCHTCKKKYQTDYHICEEDYSKRSDYIDAIRNKEDDGYRCVAAP